MCHTTKQATMKKLIAFTALGFALFMSNQSDAQNINRTQQHQVSRIKKGVKSGELTRREAVHLKMEQRKIQAMKSVAAADGKVTPKEKRRIKQAQRQAAQNIALQKNDNQRKR